MANLTHLFKIGQKVRCNMDGTFYKGTVKETYADHIIVDIPEICDHCYFYEWISTEVDAVYVCSDNGKFTHGGFHSVTAKVNGFTETLDPELTRRSK